MIRQIFTHGALVLLATIVLGASFLIEQSNRRPLLETYASLTLPAAHATAPNQVRFAGGATFVFNDG